MSAVAAGEPTWEQLVAESTTRTNRGGMCWAAMIPAGSIAHELLNYLEEQYEIDPNLVNISGATRALKKTNVKVGDVGYHFRGQCRCRKP